MLQLARTELIVMILQQNINTEKAIMLILMKVQMMLTLMNSVIHLLQQQQGQSGQSSGSNQATTQVAPAPQQTAPPPQNTVSETEFRHLQEQNELLREANQQLQSRQTRKRALIETILLCEDKENDEAMEEAVETFLKGARQKAEGDQLDSGKPSDDGCGLPSANPDGPGDGPPEVIPVPDGPPQLDLRTCRSCGQLSYTRKNMCVNTQCETWPAFRFSVLFVSCCVFP